MLSFFDADMALPLWTFLPRHFRSDISRTDISAIKIIYRSSKGFTSLQRQCPYSPTLGSASYLPTCFPSTCGQTSQEAQFTKLGICFPVSSQFLPSPPTLNRRAITGSSCWNSQLEFIQF
ncbi:hypothetical protein L596_010313 [Steinernema carpocapsae]|uniref:Uncharacterized protein n=1 Tax=Steinernema carpocapsae TaxID=34508 RepID=A0A4U5PHY5_STECR|nr:hypothetical protein L596_010313 [Steinernema carpocapsae]